MEKEKIAELFMKGCSRGICRRTGDHTGRSI